MNRLILIVIISVFWIFSPKLEAQNFVKFDTVNWVLDKDTRIESFMDREVLIGTAYLKDINIENGTIEVDVYSTGVRNFGGFMFHIQSFENYEWCWLRMHKTNGFVEDAVQYAPTYNGTSCWQLYGGSNGIAPVYLPKNEWVRLKLDIYADTARLFVADMRTPVLIMDKLQIDMQGGGIGLKGLWHDGLYFSNFFYKKGNSLNNHQQLIDENIIDHWRLSAKYKIDKFSETQNYPDSILHASNKWITPIVNPDGLVNISRYYEHKPGKTKSCAILKTKLVSTQNKKVCLQFGYSDAVTIFLNGQPLYTGNSAYRSRNMAYGGWISYNDKIYLDLKNGDNELLVVIAEEFGGWGFQAKLEGSY